VSAFAQRAVQGEWSSEFDTQNVMIHASVLPNGKVLFWSRREAGEGLNPHECVPRIWDPKLGTGAQIKTNCLRFFVPIRADAQVSQVDRFAF
jgi:hypothetical protein